MTYNSLFTVLTDESLVDDTMSHAMAAAQAYDALYFIKDAVEATGGDMSTDKLSAAMKATTQFATRGAVSMGNNNFPIQNLYLRETVKDADGNWTTKIVSTVYEAHQDPYAAECKN